MTPSHFMVSAEGVEDGGAFGGEDFGGGALGGDAAGGEADGVGVEEEGFFDVVGDGEDGDAAGGEAALEAWEKGVAEGAVEAGEGLV